MRGQMEAIRLGVFLTLSRQGCQPWMRDVRDRYSLERPVEKYKAERNMAFCGLISLLLPGDPIPE